jgi:hypothetical protein
LEVCGRRPPECIAPPSWGRHPKTFTISELEIQIFRKNVLRGRTLQQTVLYFAVKFFSSCIG